MRITLIETGNFMLDGGAIFGVVPKSLWNKQYPADERNLCNMAMRSLLIEEKDRLVLVDTGIGNKQDAKFFSYYYLNGTETLECSLRTHHFAPDDVTDVILTHLHFDHCGGAVKYDAKGNPVPAFPNARYYVSKDQWEWALHPNLRERPSYRPENYLPLYEDGRIHFIESEGEFLPGMMLKMFNGHTAGLLVPFIEYEGKTRVFVSDLLPFRAHIPLAWVCGYDTRPLISIREKEKFLQEAADRNYELIFQHDFYTVSCTVLKTEKGFVPNL